MCINCWREFGSPAIINERVLTAVGLIRELYETEDGGVGRYGHIVFDDWNTDSVESCIVDAEAGTYGVDLYCKCGGQFHIDVDFAYHVKCPSCGTVYMCNGHIELIELKKEPDNCVIEGE